MANPCGCGGYGCLEQYASATALLRMAHHRIGDAVPASASEIAKLQAKGTNRFGVVSFLGAIFSGRPHGAYQYTSEEESVKHGIFCPIHVHVAKASQLGLPSY
jgi:hypothetical protein